MGKDILKQFLKRQNHDSLATKINLENLKIEDYKIIDVRTPELYVSTPHLKGSYNIHQIHALKAFCAQHPQDKILLVCNGGLESAKYGTILVQEGLENIFYLDEHLLIIEEYFPLEYPNEEEA